MRQLATVLVGSRLHGLHNDQSDYDWRGIHMDTLKTHLSPFKKIKNTTWIEGDEDNTSYELIDFCKLATQGNATILEVFFSNEHKWDVEPDPIYMLMKMNWRKFIDTDRVVAASRGYAHNQYNKMNLFEPDKRTPKFAVAYLRVLWQCEQFLLTNEFPCAITEDSLKSFMLKIKNNFEETDIPALQGLFYEMQGRVSEAYAKAEIMKPDLEWIEDFIYGAYTKDLTGEN